MTYGEVDDEIEKNLSDSVKYGYGYYGHRLLEEDGMYFLGTITGNSCDWTHVQFKKGEIIIEV